MPDITPWHERDVFWETAAPILFTQQRWSDASAEVDKALALMPVAPGTHILDLCCGMGRHSLEMARRGFHVTGLDRTQLYLDRASEQAELEGLSAEFIQEDMRTFCKPGTFDAVVNLFTSFGYFEEAEDDRRVIINVHRSLKPGGAFLLELMGKEVLGRIFQERDWDEANGTFILQERKVGSNWEWMENRWIIFKDNKRTEFKVSHRLYSATGLTQLLTGCGFADVDVYGDLAGSPYDHLAERLVVVAHK